MNKRKILLLGASNTLGICDSSVAPCKGYKDHLQDLLGERWNVIARGAGGARIGDWLPNAPEYAINPSVGEGATVMGEMIDGELSELIKTRLFTDLALPHLPADVVIMQSGVGDAIRKLLGGVATDKEVYGRNLRDVVSALFKNGAGAVIVPKDFPARGDIQTEVGWYNEEVENLWTLHRENPRFISGLDFSILSTTNGVEFDADHFHPNDRGHKHAAFLAGKKLLEWENNQC